MFKKIISSLTLVVISIFIIPSAVSAKEYTLTIDANGGKIYSDGSSEGTSTITKTGEVGKRIELPGTAEVKKDGDSFLGWTFEKGICGNARAPSIGYKFSDKDGDTTIYACWKNTDDLTKNQKTYESDLTLSSGAKCTDECNEIAPAIRIVKIGLIPIIQILIPIALIVMGMIDFAKAMMAQRDDEMKKAQGMFIKRCLYAVAVFFVVTIVTLIFHLFSSAETGIEGADDWLSCWKVVGLNDDCTK